MYLNSFGYYLCELNFGNLKIIHTDNNKTHLTNIYTTLFPIIFRKQFYYIRK
jgi:hypothetical protein